MEQYQLLPRMFLFSFVEKQMGNCKNWKVCERLSKTSPWNLVEKPQKLWHRTNRFWEAYVAEQYWRWVAFSVVNHRVVRTVSVVPASWQQNFRKKPKIFRSCTHIFAPLQNAGGIISAASMVLAVVLSGLCPFSRFQSRILFSFDDPIFIMTRSKLLGFTLYKLDRFFRFF